MKVCPMFRFTIAAAVILLLAACDDVRRLDGSDSAEVAEQTLPVGPLSRIAVPTDYLIDLRIDPALSRFTGVTDIRFMATQTLDRIYLHGKDLDVSRATITTADGATLNASWQEVDPTGVALLRFNEQLEPGPYRLSIAYSAGFQTGIDGLFKFSDDEATYIYTQFQSTGARRAFPSFDDPQFKTPFTIAVTTGEDYTVVSNMPIDEERSQRDGQKRVRFTKTPPLPTYLLALAIGKFEISEAPPLPPTDIRETPLPLRGFTVAGKGHSLGFALENTQPLLESLETYFDIPHPYPKLDLIATPGYGFSAMENVGAIVYGEPLLLIGDDPPLTALRGYGTVHAHEIAHQWFGNLVTPTWWTDIWLNEAFASWLSHKIAAAWRPELELDKMNTLGAVRAMRSDTLVSARAVREPVRHNHDIPASFDAITYQKGAGVLAMMEHYMGEEAFRDGVRLHMRRFAHGTATAEDFAKSLSEGSGHPDLVSAFMSFVDQSGVPLLHVKRVCDSEGPRLTVHQSRYLPVGSIGSPDRLWSVPACFSVDAVHHCRVMDKTLSTLELDSCPSVIMPNAGGAGYYRFDLEPDAWQALLAGMDGLSEPEQLMLADSLAAAFSANRMDFSHYAAAAVRLARSPAWQVAQAPVSQLRQILERMTDEGPIRAAMQRWLADLYGPRLRAFGYTERADDDEQDRSRRASLAGIVAELAEDPQAVAVYARLGKAYLGFGKAEPDPDAVSSDLLETALSVAVRNEGTAFARHLQDALIKEEDRFFRALAIKALAHTRDVDYAETLRDLALKDTLTGNEAWTLISGLGNNPMHRASTFDWLKANLERVASRLPMWGRAALPAYASVFCSQSRAEEAEKFFRQHLDAITGGTQRLDEALERVQLCAALVDAKADEVRDYFDPAG